jgi:antitoxin ParD1/3/4
VNLNVSLTDELANFVTSKVAAVRYSSSSEVVREALRPMENIERQEAEKFQFLRNAWQRRAYIPMAVIANWGPPKPVAEGGLIASKSGKSDLA